MIKINQKDYKNVPYVKKIANHLCSTLIVRTFGLYSLIDAIFGL